MWIHAPIGCESEWRGWEYLGYHVQALLTLPKVGARVGADQWIGLELKSIAERIREQILQQGGALRIQRGVPAWAQKPELPT